MPSPPGPFGLLLADLAGGFGDTEPGHRLRLVALAVFSVAWVTAVGASVGSFLNVVVYRLPRGMSLVRPKSHCPACGASIRASDNLPVLGWLRLRGRCRSCGGPISARYPFVEAATAILFLGLAHFELFSGGANLPGSAGHAPGGLSFVLWHLQPALIGLYLYHVALLATLVCLALIVWDGYPPPPRLVAPALLVGYVVPLFLITRPVTSGLLLTFLPAARVPLGKVGSVPVVLFPPALLDGLIGPAVGVLTGLLTAAAVPRGPQRSVDRRGTIAVGGLIGLFLGWQAAVSCALIAAGFAVLNAVASRLTRRPLPVTGLLAAAVLVQLPLWRTLGLTAWWPGPAGWDILLRAGWPETDFSLTSLAAATAAAGAVAWAAGRLAAGVPQTASVRTEETPRAEPGVTPTESTRSPGNSA